MEKLLSILKEFNDTVDFTTAEGIIDNGIFDSLDLTALITELEDAFDIEIGMDEIVPENFNSAHAMWAMIQWLQEEK